MEARRNAEPAIGSLTDHPSPFEKRLTFLVREPTLRNTSPWTGHGFDQTPEAADHRAHGVDRTGTVLIEVRAVQRGSVSLAAGLAHPAPFHPGHEDRSTGGLTLSPAVQGRERGVQRLQEAFRVGLPALDTFPCLAWHLCPISWPGAAV